ncbi:hypothetical protein BCLUESOX_2100 [bacterium endosymbiont of Bathymodiolus sp. 5 South]|nr:hypothetical protein [uncultured Gammaproteobacteria bacterium]SHN89718.1 hypothetical protein BCLUESOX_2100 [bacterium endosymbiont of Bathymodiolus sp. 5 South]
MYGFGVYQTREREGSITKLALAQWGDSISDQREGGVYNE